MQMVRICVCHTYADAGHMDMLCISFLFTFPGQIRKKAKPERTCSVASEGTGVQNDR